MNIDKQRTHDRLVEVADEIAGVDDEAAERLRDLAAAVIAPDTSSDRWGLVDVLRVLDVDGMAEELVDAHAATRLTRFLEIIRNAFILAPVCLTWVGISIAVQGYHDALTADPSLRGESFLYLWQGAFGGRINAWFTLQRLASLDAVLIGVLFLLTFLIHSLGHSRQRRLESSLTRKRGQLTSVLTDASLCLAARQPRGVNSEAERLSLVASQLATSAQQALEIAERLARGTENMREVSRFASKAYESLTTAVSGLSGSVQELRQVQRDLVPRVGGLESKLGKLLVAQDRLFQGLQGSTAGLADSAQSAIDSVTSITEAADKITRAAASFVAAATTNGDVHVAATADLTAATRSMQELTAAAMRDLRGLAGLHDPLSKLIAKLLRGREADGRVPAQRRKPEKQSRDQRSSGNGKE